MPSEQEYIARIKELESELARTKKQKRYGLVWEDKKEDVVEQCKHELPVLVCDENKTVNEDLRGPTHILIEGDNFHALSVLAYTHAGKVDAIYIDPPYNTGNKDFIYNDSFVDKEDTFRHSKWLSFMASRLEISKTLLKDTGVIFISIDDNEQAQLKMLCDDIFGENNFIDTIMVELSNTGGMKVGSAKDGKITKNGEFVLVYGGSNYRNVERTPLFDFVPGFDSHFNFYLASNNKIRSLSEVMGESEVIQNELKHYGYKIKNDMVSLKYISDLFDKSEIIQNYIIDNLDRIVRPRTEIPNLPDNIVLETNKWIEYKSKKRSDSYFLSKTEEGEIFQLVPMRLNYRNTDDFSPKYGRSVIRGDYWKGFWIDMGNISKEGGVKFENGKKPIRLIKQLLKWALYSSKKATILDFFAGSGTTGHAVLELNKEDGGNRQFILCTNNENQIAEEVTYPRIHNVIKGYSDVEGIPANLRYYRTDFISNDKSIDDLRHKFILRCSEMLQIRESCFDVSTLNGDEYFQVFENKDLVLAILYHPYEIKRLREIISQTEKPIVAYIFSMGMEIFQEELAEYGDKVRIETVPDEILETYKKIFGF